MARYNTSLASTSVSTTTNISTPNSGAFTELTGTAPYTVTLPNPTLYPGQTQTYYNVSTGTLTLSTPSGVFAGGASSGTSTQTFPTGTTITIVSDGTNYIILNEDGGALAATTISATSTVTLSPANATVTISPSGTGTVTISPATAGSISNMAISGSTGSFTTLGASSTVTFTSGMTVSAGSSSFQALSATSLSGPLTGTIQTASQPNITSLGTLTSLVVGNSSAFSINSSGQWASAPVPNSSGGQSLGTSSLRWGTVYTNDLALSNGIGDYTIVEGEEDLFLYNNKNGKVYKFLTQEVDPSTAPPKGVQF